MTASLIQYNSRRKYHRPMREFLHSQGPFVKSGRIFDAWMRLHPKFCKNAPDSTKRMIIGRVLSDLLPKYSSDGHKSGGRRSGAVFVNVYCRKQGIGVGDVAEVSEGIY